MAEPVDPFQGGDLDGVGGSPGSPGVDQLGLEQSDLGLAEKDDAAIEDGMDVLNLSLGGSYHGNNDLLALDSTTQWTRVS